MRKLFIITGIFGIGIALISCGGAKGNDPGRVYVPDMGTSRAYETYGYNNIGDYERLKEKDVNYNSAPVAGTVARGDYAAYPYANTDSGYIQSKAYKNPFDTVTLSKAQMAEAERVYLINCGICHGTNLDGNGPLWKSGNGPFPAAPRNLTDDYSKALADGQMYHVIVHGKNMMGSYAAQLKPEQRWHVIKYIRSKQGPAKAAGAAPADTTTKK